MCDNHNPSTQPTLLEIARVFGGDTGMALLIPVSMLSEIGILLDVPADTPASRERVRVLADQMKVDGYPTDKPFKCAIKVVGGVEKVVLLAGVTRMRALLLALSEGAQIAKVPVRVKLDMKWADPTPADQPADNADAVAASDDPGEVAPQKYAHIAVCGRFVDMEAGQAMTLMFEDATIAGVREQYTKDLRDWAEHSETPPDHPVAMVAVSSATPIVEAYGMFAESDVQLALSSDAQPYLAVIGNYDGSERDQVMFFRQRTVENAQKLFLDTLRGWAKDSAAEDRQVSIASVLVSLTPMTEAAQKTDR